MKNFENFMWIDGNITLEGPEMDEAVNDFINLIKKHAGIVRWHRRHTDHLRLILINLYLVNDLDPTRYIAFSRDPIKYTQYNETARRYRFMNLRYEAMKHVIDTFKDPEFGFIEQEIGFQNPGTGNRKTSKMRATEKLIILLRDTYKIPIHNAKRPPDLDVIVMRNKKYINVKQEDGTLEKVKKKYDVEYTDTSDTRRMRANLKRINSLIEKHFIGLALPDRNLEKMTLEMISKGQREKGKVRNIDFTQTTNRRVFNNGKWDQGGRFYSGWWQEVPSDYRKHIRIDNFSTVEIDFSGLHFALLYLEEGLSVPKDDAYELNFINDKVNQYVNGLTVADLQVVIDEHIEENPIEAGDIAGSPLKGEVLRIYNKAARLYLKKAANIALNAEDQKSAISAINLQCRIERKKAPFLKSVPTKDLIQRLKDKHSLLGDIFYTGRGVFLQNVDSHIAERVQLILADKDIPVLCVHDSFIVSRLHEKDLFDAMKTATTERYGEHLKSKTSETALGEIWRTGLEDDFRYPVNLEAHDHTAPEKYKEYYKRMHQFEQRTGKDVMALWEKTRQRVIA